MMRTTLMLLRQHGADFRGERALKQEGRFPIAAEASVVSSGIDRIVSNGGLDVQEFGSKEF